MAGVDLSGVEAFADLPDDARDTFAVAAVITDLKKDEECSGFALAQYVPQGRAPILGRFSCGFC